MDNRRPPKGENNGDYTKKIEDAMMKVRNES